MLRIIARRRCMHYAQTHADTRARNTQTNTRVTSKLSSGHKPVHFNSLWLRTSSWHNRPFSPSQCTKPIFMLHSGVNSARLKIVGITIYRHATRCRWLKRTSYVCSSSEDKAMANQLCGRMFKHGSLMAFESSVVKNIANTQQEL